MKSNSWLADNIKSIIGLFIVITVEVYLFMITITTTDITVRSQALIAQIALITGVTGYYFGYSQGAAKKDEAALNLASNSQTTTSSTTVSPIVPPVEPTTPQ